MLEKLNDANAPVCGLVQYVQQPNWIVTRFAGLSLSLLGQEARADWPGPISLEERVAVWYWFLGYWDPNNRLASFLPLDLTDRNIVVPIKDGILNLQSPVSIDHAHTVVNAAQRKITQPVWISYESEHLAPEVRQLLKKGYDEYQAWKQTQQVNPSIQPVQNAFNRGDITANKVIQYSVGYAIHKHLDDLNDDLQLRLARVVKRLCQNDPKDRYEQMSDARVALGKALQQVRLTSDKTYALDLPRHLVLNANANPKKPLLDLSGVQPEKCDTASSDAPFQGGGGYTETVREQAHDAAPSAHSAPPVAEPRKPSLDESSQDPSPRTGLPRWIPAAVALALGQALGWPLGWWIASGW